MLDIYDTLRDSWGDFEKNYEIFRLSKVKFLLSGENWIHDNGFFPMLSNFINCLGEKKWWLLNLDGSPLSIEFNYTDTEEGYFQKLRTAPDWQPTRPFPYAVQRQCFMGSGNWLLLSDRDAERMDLIMKGEITAELVEYALQLIPS